MSLEFTAKMIFWRGPAPFYFVPIPAEESAAIKDISTMVTYGWGVIPVTVRIGKTTFKTSLFPKDDLYLVPIKVAVRKAEDIDDDDEVTLQLEIG
ncbi:MAG: DUF1905 domain-containing protein [Anaerolineaceae bacterium]|nr:DUF1905 domain-containing protein [Anaerolineaceae bacterium]